MIVEEITQLIGHTPLLKINSKIHGIKNLNVYAKLELFNPWGSVKDRTALGMLTGQLDELKEGKKRVIELSSSNTAKALQMLSQLNGSSTKTITNRIKVPEQRDILKLVGTEIQELPGKSECYDPNDPNDPMKYIQDEISTNPNGYLHTDQYNNKNNYKIHFERTGPEIAAELNNVSFVIGGVGTNGSIMGISEALKLTNSDLKSVGVVSDKDDFIPGIRNKDEVLEVGLFDPAYYEEILTVNSQEAVDYSLKLIREQGLLAGPTTGASLAGIVKYFEDKELTEETNVVFIACDRAEFYLSYYKERRPEIFAEAKKASWIDELDPVAEVEISAAEMQSMLAAEVPLIVDTRNPLSFKAGHIEGSMNLPFDTLDSLLNETNPFCKHHKIVFICAVGEKSKMVASYFHHKGYQCYSLQEGVNGWRDSGYKLENDL